MKGASFHGCTVACWFEPENEIHAETMHMLWFNYSLPGRCLTAVLTLYIYNHTRTIAIHSFHAN